MRDEVGRQSLTFYPSIRSASGFPDARLIAVLR